MLSQNSAEQQVYETLGHLGIELPARVGPKPADGLLLAQGSAIGPIAGHRVIGIRHGNDPGLQGNILPG